MQIRSQTSHKYCLKQYLAFVLGMLTFFSLSGCFTYIYKPPERVVVFEPESELLGAGKVDGSVTVIGRLRLHLVNLTSDLKFHYGSETYIPASKVFIGEYRFLNKENDKTIFELKRTISAPVEGGYFIVEGLSRDAYYAIHRFKTHARLPEQPSSFFFAKVLDNNVNLLSLGDQSQILEAEDSKNALRRWAFDLENLKIDSSLLAIEPYRYFREKEKVRQFFAYIQESQPQGVKASPMFETSIFASEKIEIR